MNVEKFIAARKKFEKGKPFDNAEEYNRVYNALERHTKPEHAFTNTGSGHTDQLTCACGWKSEPYWDGAEFAWTDWLNHVADSIGLIPKECPCGKEYVPFQGEAPCHKLIKVKKRR